MCARYTDTRIEFSTGVRRERVDQLSATIIPAKLPLIYDARNASRVAEEVSWPSVVGFIWSIRRLNDTLV